MGFKYKNLVLVFTTVALLTGCGGNKVEDKNISDTKPVEVSAEKGSWESEPAYNETIKIGYNGGLCLGAFGIAQVEGFYEAEGLKTEIVKMSGQTDALGTGQVDVAGDHIATLLVPAVNGVNMMFSTGCHTGCKSLYTLADSGIEKTSDFIGKTIAVPDGIGASDHNISLRFLNHDNVDPKDVKFKPVETSAVILAMENGEVDGATLSDQYAKKFLDEGKLKIVRSLTFDEDFSKEACCVHAVNRDFYEANPITVEKLTRAHQNASDWIQDNQEEAVKILLENKWASGDYDLVLEILKTYNFKIDDESTGQTLRDIVDDYKEFGLIDKSKDTDKILDYLWDPVLQK